MKLEMWWPVAVGFAAGAMVGSAVLLLDLAWHRSHDHPLPYTPRTADVVGRWEGEENFGTTFVVTRKADGTFTETRDSSRSGTPTSPPVVTLEGRYAVAASSYGYYYTKSSDAAFLNQPPVVGTLHDCTPTELNYAMGERNGAREIKK